MATTIKWIDNSSVETAHRIYKSITYFTKDNLPAPLAELSSDITEYEDINGTDGENWYIVSALINDYEVFSEPFIPGLTTAYIHDVFRDGSAVATYNFDGDATDLGGNNTLDNSVGASYASGLIGNAYQPLSGEYIRGNSNTFDLGTSSWTFSFWTKLNSFDDISTENVVPRFFSKAYLGSSTTRYSFGVEPTGALRLLLDGGSNGDNTMSANDAIVLNEWQHVVLVIERDVDSRAYVNSTMIFDGFSTLPSSTNRTSNYDFGIGSYNNSSGFINGQAGVIDGVIDQFRVFNRVLTQQEVDTLYQEGASFL